jgi:hypothetical protein
MTLIVQIFTDFSILIISYQFQINYGILMTLIVQIFTDIKIAHCKPQAICQLSAAVDLLITSNYQFQLSSFTNYTLKNQFKTRGLGSFFKIS